MASCESFTVSLEIFLGFLNPYKVLQIAYRFSFIDKFTYFFSSLTENRNLKY